MAGNGAEAYSQLGHGGVRADGNRSGEIDVTLAGDLTLTGVNTTRQYALVGHGDEPEALDQNNTVAGNVSLRAGGNVTLTNAFLGHLIDNNGTYTSGNTLLGVRGDLTADANSQVFSAAPAQNGELRFYVGGQDLVNSNTLLNGVAHGGTPFPNNQGNFAFGDGPYNPAPNTNFAYYMVTIEDRSFIVTIPTDTVDAFDHETSLREAVDFANLNPGADTITFDASLANQTIPITLGQIVVTETGADNRTTINGPSGGIVISGNNATRPIQINGGVFATLDGLTFVDGYADQGGAIVNLGDLTVSNSTFRNNFADANAGASGGVGGAISNLGVLNVSNSLFDLNRGELGGAINSSNGLTVTDSTFTSNVAIFNGGGLRSFGTTIISGSTFSNNQAANGGGGLINHGDLTIVNSTLAHNTALDGGGLQVFGGTAELTHVTVAYNTATRAGGGLAANVSTVTATNTIIAGNSAPNQNDVWGNLAPASSFNLLNQSAATAGLDTLGDNGGLTQTVALLTGSPALDAGTNTVALPEFDQRGTGFDRIAGGGVDIGAFELQNQAPVFTSPATADVPENTQAVLALSASDPDVPAQTITFSVAGSGADNDKFEIVSGNQLRFKAAPDFETPQDVGGVAAGDNVYEVTVSAADGNGGVTNQVIAVTVIDTDEIAPTPTITSISSVRLEGTTISVSGSATDPGSAVAGDGVTLAWEVFKDGVGLQQRRRQRLQLHAGRQRQLPDRADGDRQGQRQHFRRANHHGRQRRSHADDHQHQLSAIGRHNHQRQRFGNRSRQRGGERRRDAGLDSVQRRFGLQQRRRQRLQLHAGRQRQLPHRADGDRQGQRQHLSRANDHGRQRRSHADDHEH